MSEPPTNAQVQQLVHSLAEAERGSLEVLAIMGRFGIPIAALLTGKDAALLREDVSTFESRGIVSLDAGEGDEDGYVVGEAFRSVVLSDMMSRNRKRFGVVSEQAAREFARAGMPAQAFTIAVDAELWSLANAIALRAGMQMTADGGGLLANAIPKIPVEVAVDFPVLGLFAIVVAARRANVTRTPISSRSLAMVRALRAMPDRQYSGVDLVMLYAVRVIANSAIDRRVDDEVIGRAVLAFGELGEFERRTAPGALEFAAELIGWTLILAGSPQAVPMFISAVETSRSNSDQRSLLRVSCHLAVAHAVQGQFRYAREVMAHIDPGEARREVQSSAVVTYDLSMALTALGGLDRDSAYAHMAALAETREGELQSSLIKYIRFELAALYGDLEERFGVLNLGITGMDSPGSRQFTMLTAAKARVAMALGQIPRASLLLSDPGLDSEEAGPARGRIALANGDPAKALHYTEPIVAGEAASSRIRADALIVSMLAFLRLGREEDARTRWMEAAVIAEQTENYLCLARIPAAEREAVLRLRPDGPFTTMLSDTAFPNPMGQPRSISHPPVQELAILEGLMRGLTLAEIGRQNNKSLNTIKTQTAHLYKRLGVTSRSDAVTAAIFAGYLSGPSQSTL